MKSLGKMGLVAKYCVTSGREWKDFKKLKPPTRGEVQGMICQG